MDVSNSYSLVESDNIRDGIFWDHLACGWMFGVFVLPDCLILRELLTSVVPHFVISVIVIASSFHLGLL